MNHSVISMSILQFALVYLLLIVVLFIMKKAQIDKSKLLIVASIRMTAQLVLVGFILQYILGNPRPIFTVMFLAVMLVFSIYRIYNTRPDLNRRFKVAVAVSLCFSGLAVLGYFVAVVVGVDVFNPQYTIPLAGMIIGNAMTGVTLGLKTFMEGIKAERKKIETLMNLGIDFKTILQPFVNNALENALLPTINSMLGMGIIFLPGMMTGQILSGTVPTTAIMYQIAIMIAICTSVCLTVFLTLNLGYKTLYNSKQQFIG